MQAYWDKRYIEENKIWGGQPSKTAEYALGCFRKHGIKKILIPGSGYGRNSRFFSDNGFDVTGIEISKVAFNLAKKFNPKSKMIHGSVLNIPFNSELYDGIYCFNVLHLFLGQQRKKIIEKCFNKLKDQGFVFFVVFSEKESSFGNGKKIEPFTYESKPGRPIHYFSEENLTRHFEKFNIIETGLIEESENHGERGPHNHKLRFLFAQKSK